jgi:hypothetical protein
MGEESSRVTCREEMNMRKAWRVTGNAIVGISPMHGKETKGGGG